MKRLIMCEGSNELEIIRILLENDVLIFTEDDLLGLTPFHARQIKSGTQVYTELGLYPGNDVLIMRVGDTQTDKLKLPKDIQHKIQAIEKYCTKPELEMLLIIAEGLTADFEHQKQYTPKEYAKRNIYLGKKRYDNSSAFYRDYFGESIDSLTDAIREYKRIKAHNRDEMFLADILR